MTIDLFSERLQAARADGFASVHEMAGWFKDQHGLPFDGWLITWRLNR